MSTFIVCATPERVHQKLGYIPSWIYRRRCVGCDCEVLAAPSSVDQAEQEGLQFSCDRCAYGDSLLILGTLSAAGLEDMQRLRRELQSLN